MRQIWHQQRLQFGCFFLYPAKSQTVIVVTLEVCMAAKKNTFLRQKSIASSRMMFSYLFFFSCITNQRFQSDYRTRSLLLNFALDSRFKKKRHRIVIVASIDFYGMVQSPVQYVPSPTNYLIKVFSIELAWNRFVFREIDMRTRWDESKWLLCNKRSLHQKSSHILRWKMKSMERLKKLWIKSRDFF